jgi:hypothetical protein
VVQPSSSRHGRDRASVLQSYITGPACPRRAVRPLPPMSQGWTPSDKAVAKVAADRARRRAEQEAIRFHADYKMTALRTCGRSNSRSENGARTDSIALRSTTNGLMSSSRAGLPEVGYSIPTSSGCHQNVYMQSMPKPNNHGAGKHGIAVAIVWLWLLTGCGGTQVRPLSDGYEEVLVNYRGMGEPEMTQHKLVYKDSRGHRVIVWPWVFRGLYP